MHHPWRVLNVKIIDQGAVALHGLCPHTRAARYQMLPLHLGHQLLKRPKNILRQLNRSHEGSVSPSPHLLWYITG